MVIIQAALKESHLYLLELHVTKISLSIPVSNF